MTTTTSLTLAIATATPQVGVAIGRDGVTIAAVHIHQGRRHGELLAPAIESLLALAGHEIKDLEQVAVDIGPGLFTGLRVGVATAKALASALEVPVVGCSSLDILAHRHRHTDGMVAAVVDARRGEIFWALYRGGRQISEPKVSDPKALLEATEATETATLTTGDGARRYAGLLTATTTTRLTIAPEEFDHPSPEALLELAHSAPAVPAEQITPTYMRGADVRIGWEQRDG